MPIRVILVDDHAVVRSGLRRVLEAGSDIEVVGEASNVRDAVFEVRAQKPDVIVMDVVMPGASGIEGTPLVLHEAPDAKVLVLSMQDDPRYVREAFAQGASGYVLKEAADTEVVEAVRQVAERSAVPAPGPRRAASGVGGAASVTRRLPTHSPNVSEKCCGCSRSATRTRRSPSCSTSRCAQPSRTGRTSCRSFDSGRGPSSFAMPSPTACSRRTRRRISSCPQVPARTYPDGLGALEERSFAGWRTRSAS